jgi:hypothetical protein
MVASRSKPLRTPKTQQPSPVLLHVISTATLHTPRMGKKKARSSTSILRSRRPVTRKIDKLLSSSRLATSHNSQHVRLVAAQLAKPGERCMCLVASARARVTGWLVSARGAREPGPWSQGRRGAYRVSSLESRRGLASRAQRPLGLKSLARDTAACVKPALVWLGSPISPASGMRACHYRLKSRLQ